MASGTRRWKRGEGEEEEEEEEEEEDQDDEGSCAVAPDSGETASAVPSSLTAHSQPRYSRCIGKEEEKRRAIAETAMLKGG